VAQANVKDRAALLAAGRGAREGAREVPAGTGEVWVDLGSTVVLIDHHQFEKDDATWARFERDTNVHRSAPALPARRNGRTRPLETRAPRPCVQQARIRNARCSRTPDRVGPGPGAAGGGRSRT
jgi:hypothetical protein